VNEPTPNPPAVARPPRPESLDYTRWLGRVELAAILPLKWGMLAVCILYWLWARDWEPPSTLVFMALFLYGAATLAEHVLFWLDRFAVREIRTVVYGSYFLDLVFITAIIWLDLREPGSTLVQVAPGSDYYILYLLLILRGFALFRTKLENIVVAALISVLFLLSLLWQGQELTVLNNKAVLLRLGLVWAIMLLSVFLVDIVNQQKEEVLRVRERLLRSEGLASLGELTAGVAHEINNPIGIIKTYAEYLKRSVPAEDPNHEDFDTIFREAERCEGIVRRMLDFANPAVRGLEPMEVADVVRETVRFVQKDRHSDGIALTVEIDERLPTVLGDAGQVRQALLNLLLNARQLLVENAVASPAIGVRVRQLPGPRAPVEVAVHDNGPGIAPEDAERAFEPFFTRRAGGTGLGLAITRRIVEAHGGAIAIWPAANGGTTVAFTIPIPEDGA
jgi:signal transduction histidine kinase